MFGREGVRVIVRCHALGAFSVHGTFGSDSWIQLPLPADGLDPPRGRAVAMTTRTSAPTATPTSTAGHRFGGRGPGWRESPTARRAMEPQSSGGSRRSRDRNCSRMEVPLKERAESPSSGAEVDVDRRAATTESLRYLVRRSVGVVMHH